MIASKDELLTTPIPAMKRFYTKALSEAERLMLEEALQVQGLDEEIAILRLRLSQALEEHPEDIELMFKGTALLARLITTKFGLSKGDSDQLQNAIEQAVFALNEMHPEGSDE